MACSNFPCNCAGNGADAVESKTYGGLGVRWFIVMGHAGFNSPANNGAGYGTETAARAAIKRYQGKGARKGA